MFLKFLNSKKRLHKVLKQILLSLLSIGLIFLSISLYTKFNAKKIAEIQGISIYTADKNNKQNIIYIVDTCMQQIKDKGIQDNFKETVIFSSDAKEYNRRTFFRGGGTLAKNIYFMRIIVCAPADFSINRQYARHENLHARRLSDILAHELMHSYLYKKLGFIRFKKMMIYENWKSEGFSDYIANSSSLDIEDGKRIFIENGEKQAEIEASRDIWKYVYFYFKSRMKVDYLLSYKKMSFDDFINTKFDEQKLENEIREALQKGLYTFDKQ